MSSTKMFPNLPRTEPKLRDSTAVTKYMECPRKYFYSMVLGYKKTSQEPYFAFGNAYHKFREVLEIHWMADPQLSNSQDYIMAALERAMKYAKKHLVPGDKGTKWEFMNVDRVMKSCLKGAEHWLREKKEGRIEVIAIEQPFQIVLPDGEIIAGRLDQKIIRGGKPRGRDFKTSSQAPIYYSKGLSPNDQFSRYTFAENKLVGWDENDPNHRPPVEGQDIEVLFNTKTTGPAIETYPVNKSRHELMTWLKEQEFWHRMLSMSREEDRYPMNTKSCNFCEFHKVCAMSSETMQQSYLKNNFKHEPWDCTHSTKEDE